MAFLNSFLTYLFMVVIFAALAGVGIAIGIHLRKKKNSQMPEEAEEK